MKTLSQNFEQFLFVLIGAISEKEKKRTSIKISDICHMIINGIKRKDMKTALPDLSSLNQACCNQLSFFIKNSFTFLFF